MTDNVSKHLGHLGELKSSWKNAKLRLVIENRKFETLQRNTGNI